MGKPKFSRKKYETPSHPWQEDRIKAENDLIKKYGLKNKREVWRAETSLRKYRGQARELLARISGGDPQIKKESDQLLMHLTRLNILPPNSTLDDVLALETEPILSRRLQTLTYLKGLANTPSHARQLISHGHISIGDRKVTVPGYMVTKEEEGEIKYVADSPMNDVMHPARPRADFKSVPIKKEPEKPKEEKPAEPAGEKPEETGEPEKAEEPPAEKPKEEEKPVEEPPKEEKPSEEPPKEEEKPTEEPPQEEKPVTEGEPAEKEEKLVEEPPQEEPPVEEPPKDEAGEPEKPEDADKKEKTEVEKKPNNKEGGK